MRMKNSVENDVFGDTGGITVSDHIILLSDCMFIYNIVRFAG